MAAILKIKKTAVYQKPLADLDEILKDDAHLTSRL